MQRLTVNDATLALLRSVHEVTQVHDERGQVVGYFMPTASSEEDVEFYLIPVRPAELEQRKADKHPGFSTREVFEHLKSLTTDEGERAHLDKLIAEVAERDRCATT